MNTWNERLDSLLKESPKTAKDLSDFSGVAPSSITDMRKNRVKSLDSEFLFKAADFFGVRPRWLALGEGEKHAKPQQFNMLTCLNSETVLSATEDLLPATSVSYLYEGTEFSKRWDSGDILLIDTTMNTPRLGFTYLFLDPTTDSYMVRRYTMNDAGTGYGLVTDDNARTPGPYTDIGTIQGVIAGLKCIGRIRKRITDNI